MTPDGQDDIPTGEELAELLEEIGRIWMPFGKYGPKEFPPLGVPLCDLPAEYLHWFKVKGFPKGELGRLMEIVYQAKIDGADLIFDQIRKRNGGRHPLRKTRKRSFTFDDDTKED